MKNTLKFIVLTLFVSTSLLAQQPYEVKVKVEYKDVTPSKPHDYVTPMKESLDMLDRVAKEKSRQYEQNRQQQQNKDSEEFANSIDKWMNEEHEKYLRIVGLGRISKIMSLEDGTYRAVQVRSIGKNRDIAISSDSDSTLLVIKNNKISIICKEELDKIKCSECDKYLVDAVKTGSDEYGKCIAKYLNEVKYFVGDHFINSKFENGIISIIDLKTYQTKEFILVDEIIKVLSK